MRFTARFLAISAAIAKVLALPALTNSAYDVVEGQPFTITWSNASGAVTLELKDGASSDLKTVSTIASGITGTSFTWTPSGLASDTYAIAISDTTGTNYSPQFSYAGTGAVPTTASTSSTATPTTATTTGSTASTDSTTSATTTGSSSSVTSASSTASGLSNSTTTASTLSTSRSTPTSSSSSSGSTSTPINTNGSKKLGSSLAFVVLTAAALMVCH